jgi:hypothetical protein
MAKFIEYDLDENTTVLIEAPEDVNGIVNASKGDVDIIKSGKKFSTALTEIRAQAALLLKEINSLQVDEAEVKFGLTTVGEIGNLAIGKMGMGVNYEVTLRWKKNATQTKEMKN